jgi:hypothetical protein
MTGGGNDMRPSSGSNGQLVHASVDALLSDKGDGRNVDSHG